MTKSDEAWQTALAFYGRKCVVRGSSSELTRHHLDENRKNNAFQNLVPLSDGLNTNIIELHRRDRKRDLGELAADRLDASAREHFNKGDYACASACSRISAHIQWKHNEDTDVAAGCLANALLSLRLLDPKWSAPILNLVMAQVRSLLQEDVSLKHQAALALEIAAYFNDYELPDEGVGWTQLANALIAKAKVHGQIGRNDTLPVRALHKHGQARLRIGDDGGAKDVNKAKDLSQNIGYRFGAANADLERILYATINGKTKRAVRMLEDLEANIAPISAAINPNVGQDFGQFTWPAMIDATLLKCSVLYNSGQKKHALDLAATAKLLIVNSRITPTWLPEFVLLARKSDRIPGLRKKTDLWQFRKHAQRVFERLKSNLNCHVIRRYRKIILSPKLA